MTLPVQPVAETEESVAPAENQPTARRILPPEGTVAVVVNVTVLAVEPAAGVFLPMSGGAEIALAPLAMSSTAMALNAVGDVPPQAIEVPVKPEFLVAVSSPDAGVL